MKKKITCEIIGNDQISEGIYSTWIAYDLYQDVIPGQFVGLYPKDSSTLLPRPISICEVDPVKCAIRLVYRVVGKGTGEFAGLSAGDKIDVLGTLGNGYDLRTADDKSAVTLMAGGIGIPPMLELSKQLKQSGKNVSAILGYRTSDLFLSEDLAEYADIYIATDDGSAGYHGNVVAAIDGYKLNPDIIYACGPMPMLRGIKACANTLGIPAYISLEERMACGVGACLGCVCRTANVDSHSHVNNARICTDGPVFNAEDVEI